MIVRPYCHDGETSGEYISGEMLRYVEIFPVEICVEYVSYTYTRHPKYSYLVR